MRAFFKLAASAAVLVFSLCCASAAWAQDTDETEAQMGAETYQQLKSQGVLVKSSPLYDVLRPIAGRITKVVQPQYAYPIHFYIVHNKQPNAFATPGGNIYVNDSLFYFVHNRDELAGTLCHETSHLLYHDSVDEMKHEQAVERREEIAELLLGPDIGTILAATVLGELDSLHFSRDVEERADFKGADTCAAAHLNPWGLVWLMQDFSRADLDRPPEILSDHPDDQARIQRLEQHFKQNPAQFARYSADRKYATAMQLPKKPSEQIAR